MFDSGAFSLTSELFLKHSVEADVNGVPQQTHLMRVARIECCLNRCFLSVAESKLDLKWCEGSCTIIKPMWALRVLSMLRLPILARLWARLFFKHGLTWESFFWRIDYFNILQLIVRDIYDIGVLWLWLFWHFLRLRWLFRIIGRNHYWLIDWLFLLRRLLFFFVLFMWFITIDPFNLNLRWDSSSLWSLVLHLSFRLTLVYL